MSSQTDTERADSGRERGEPAASPQLEHAGLTAIYVGRGLNPQLTEQVATELTAHDALSAHARDELGISSALAARPGQAALASAATVSIGAVLPLLVVLIVRASSLLLAVSGSSLLSPALLGATSARAGGAPLQASLVRVPFWGALAMAMTADVGWVFGVSQT